MMQFKTVFDMQLKRIRDCNLEESALYLFVEDIYGFNRTDIILNSEVEIDERRLIEYVDKYISGSSPQYIIGSTYFINRKFYVNENVLIPRFETEEVVLEAINIIKEKGIKSVVDVGTGSGVIAISIDLETTSQVEAVDISSLALNVAIRNSEQLNSNVNFFENDMLSNLEDKCYEMIVSNPPYIAYDEFVAKDVLRNEPHLALFADDNGMRFYECIIDVASKMKCLKYIVFEIGSTQRDRIIKLAHKYLNCVVNVKKDINGCDRIAIIEIDGG